MKKITFLLILLMTSLGYSQQVVLEDFEGTPPTFNGFEGLASATITADPVNGSNTAGELITSAAGQGWQGAELILQSNMIDLSTDKTVSVDVYSTTAFNLLGKVEDKVNNTAPDSAADESHTGSGWETLTFTFTEAKDGTVAANGEYSQIAFFPNWNGAGWNAPPIEITIYVDNITAVAGAAIGTCSNGVMDGDETGVDCGGSCPACPFLPSAAPTPSTPNAEVLSLYGDTGGFTNIWPVTDSFGGFDSKVDLDPTAGVNEAIRMDFSVQGYVEQSLPVTDLTAYNWLHFDYFIDDNVAPGPMGEQILLELITQTSGYNYELTLGGSDGTLALGSWQSVDVPLSFYEGKGFDKTIFELYKLGTTSDLYSKIVFFDNIYFSVNQGTLGTDDFAQTSFSLYPNPTNDSWTVKSKNQSISSIQVYDILGKNVLSLSPNSSEVKIDASRLTSGLYFAQIKTDNGINSIKLIKK